MHCMVVGVAQILIHMRGCNGQGQDCMGPNL